MNWPNFKTGGPFEIFMNAILCPIAVDLLKKPLTGSGPSPELALAVSRRYCRFGAKLAAQTCDKPKIRPLNSARPRNRPMSG